MRSYLRTLSTATLMMTMSACCHKFGLTDFANNETVLLVSLAISMIVFVFTNLDIWD